MITTAKTFEVARSRLVERLAKKRRAAVIAGCLALLADGVRPCENLAAVAKSSYQRRSIFLHKLLKELVSTG